MVDDLLVVEKNIFIILCKLENIFSPRFFDSIEHLLIHLAYKARVCGPIQHTWMYLFEWEIAEFKRMIKNRDKEEK